jgi:hypothetical protein
MISIEKYSKENLAHEMLEIKNTDRNKNCPELTLCEKSIIYKYTNDGFEEINELLRNSKGKKNDTFGKFLNFSLKKLPNFDGLVYRAAQLTKSEIDRYIVAFDNNTVIQEYSFISTSKSRLTAMSYRGNVVFRISSRTGKDIEKYLNLEYMDSRMKRKCYFNQIENSEF